MGRARGGVTRWSSSWRAVNGTIWRWRCGRIALSTSERWCSIGPSNMGYGDFRLAIVYSGGGGLWSKRLVTKSLGDSRVATRKRY